MSDRFIIYVIDLSLILFVFSISKAQNTSLPVGSVPGSADVTAMGAATYSIPIEVVPGTQGVQPNLSVIYNSMAGTGLLGTHWDLDGLSAITRVGQNMFLDLRSTSVSMDYSDRFALDGNRLVCYDPNLYGRSGTLYQPEFEDFSKIYSYGTLGDGPEYFKVYQDDGSVVEYGNTADSRQRVGNGVYSWYVNKIADINGNYMTFTYGNDGSEIWIDHIDYTGNESAGLVPYARVTFTYSDISHVGSFFVAGREISQTRLLRAITVQYKNGISYEMVRQYLFEYTEVFPMRLTSVRLKGSDGSELNPTAVEWTESLYNDNLNNTLFTIQNFNGGNGHLAVDFNRDGVCDIIEYSLNYWTPFFKQGNVIVPGNQNYSTSTSWNIKNCLPADIDGDGFSEIVTVCQTYYDNNILVDVTNQAMQTNHVVLPFSTEGYGGVATGDFLGNGKHQIVVMYYYNNATYIKFISGTHDFTQQTVSGVMDVMDFDGDGKVELVVSTGQHLTIYKFEPSTELFDLIASLNIDGGFVTSGDFNGDGISDILYQNGNYHIALGNGRTFTYVPTNLGFQHNMSNLQIYPTVLDLNNDGYDDLMTFYSVSGGDMKAIGYLCCGYYDNKVYFQNPFPAFSSPVILTSSELNDHYNFTFGDFNNDHHVDLVASKSVNSLYDGILLCEFKMEKRVPQVKKVTAGDGSFVKWRYQDIFGLFYRYASHISILPYQYNVVESMINSLGTSIQTNTHQYFFDHPTYSFKRKQRMGFLTTSSMDVNSQITDSVFYQVVTGENALSQDFIMPVFKKTYVSHQLYKSLGFQTACLTFNNNKRRFPYILKTTDTNHLNQTLITNIDLRLPTGRPIVTQKTVQNESDFYPQFSERLNYRQTTHNIPSGGFVTLADSIVKETWMDNSSIKSVQKHLFTYNNRYLPEQITTLSDGVSSSCTIQNYDHFGNGTLTTYSGDSCLSKTITTVYDNTGRFCIYQGFGSSFGIYRTFSPTTSSLLSVMNENNLNTNFTYDAFGRLLEIHYPDGNTDMVEYGWNTDSEIPNAKYYTLTHVSGRTYATERYYDLLGRNICMRENGYYSDTCFDLKGNVYRISEPYIRGTSDADKLWHDFQYDQYGRITNVIGPYTNESYQYSGYTTTVTDNLRQTVSTQITDAAGRIRYASDQGGTVTYNYSHILYNDNVATQTDITACGHNTSIISDASGNQLKITDPNAGVVTKRYNAQNQLLQQTDARGNKTRWKYDEWGRTTERKNSNSSNDSVVCTYEYDEYTAAHRGRGKLSCVKIDGAFAERFTYDTLSRLSQHTRYIDDSAYSESYAYNTYGQLSALTYPDGFATDYTYTGKGLLSQITRGGTTNLIYFAKTYNRYGKPLKCRYGNGTVTEYSYNEAGLPTRIKTGSMILDGPVKPIFELSAPALLNSIPPNFDDGIYTVDSSIQDFRYSYDNMGRLTQRIQKNNQYETFQYDNMDRLTSFTPGTLNGTFQTFSTVYDAQGNILSNTLAGIYSYGSNKPHAVTEVTPSTNFPNAISADSCETDYNVFNQPSRIAEGDVEILLEYGADNQRVKAVFKRNGDVERTRYYISANYEKEVDAAGVTTHYNYIYGATGLAAICVRRNGADSMYYVHHDHLGSYTHITDSSRQVIRALHFDPWGNVKADTNWTVFADREPGELVSDFCFDRGFTGHEHYADLNIINMNGRLYDPVIARFFSPDNFVKEPGSTQSYNRYSYCLNNPLQYVDPSGEEVFAPWYWDVFGHVKWVDFGEPIPFGGTPLGLEGVFTSGDEMRYYYADGRISDNNVPQVFINWEKPVDFAFSFSSFPMRGAGFYRIGDPSEQTGSLSSNFHYVAPINPGYINGLNGFGVANGVKTNLIEAAVRYNYKSANSWWEFHQLRAKQQEFRKSRTLGKTGAKYLNHFEKLGRRVAIVSGGLETYNYVSYSMLNGLQWDVSLKYGLDMAMLIAGTIGGPVGLAISTSYFVLDLATDGFGGFGKMY